MTGDEAIKALDGLKAVSEIAMLRLEPNDIIVIESDDVLDSSTFDTLHGMFREQFPRHNVVILDAGMKIKAVRS